VGRSCSDMRGQLQASLQLRPETAAIPIGLQQHLLEPCPFCYRAPRIISILQGRYAHEKPPKWRQSKKILYRPLTRSLELWDVLREIHATTARWAERWSKRRKLKVRFLRPHQASFLSSPIFLVSFPPMDMVMQPKTCSTRSD
jgi:hypothetical protein